MRRSEIQVAGHITSFIKEILLLAKSFLTVALALTGTASPGGGVTAGHLNDYLVVPNKASITHSI